MAHKFIIYGGFNSSHNKTQRGIEIQTEPENPITNPGFSSLFKKIYLAYDKKLKLNLKNKTTKYYNSHNIKYDPTNLENQINNLRSEYELNISLILKGRRTDKPDNSKIESTDQWANELFYLSKFYEKLYKKLIKNPSNKI